MFCLIPRFGGFQSFCFHVCGIFGGGVLKTMATKRFCFDPRLVVFFNLFVSMFVGFFLGHDGFKYNTKGPRVPSVSYMEIIFGV